MDNKNLPPNPKPEFKEFSFDITCNPCGFQQKIPISDTNINDAKTNAQQGFLLTHNCPISGRRTVNDLVVK